MKIRCSFFCTLSEICPAVTMIHSIQRREESDRLAGVMIEASEQKDVILNAEIINLKVQGICFFKHREESSAETSPAAYLILSI
ncbi:hypothetical protein SDJN03_05336, partial [Cucurbita argyrosperma subsp. sororia]